MSPRNMAVAVGSSFVLVEILNSIILSYFLPIGVVGVVGSLVVVSILAVFFISAAKWARLAVAIFIVLCTIAGGLAYSGEVERFSPVALWYLANVGYGVVVLGLLLFSGKMDQHFSPY